MHSFSIPAYSRSIVYIYICICLPIFADMYSIDIYVCFRSISITRLWFAGHSAKRPTFMQFAQRFVCVWLRRLKKTLGNKTCGCDRKPILAA